MNERTNTPFKSLFFALSIIPLVIPGILFTVAWILLAQPEDRHHQPGAAGLARPRGAAVQHLLAGRDDLGRRAALLADGVPADDRRVPRHGSVARGVGDDERRQHLPGGVARDAQADLAGDLRDASSSCSCARSSRSRCRRCSGCRSASRCSPRRSTRRCTATRARSGLASAYAVTLLVITTVGVYFVSRLSSRGSKYATMTGKGFRPRQIDLGRWRWFTAAIFIVYFLLIVVLPFSVLLWSSFQRFYAVPSMEALQNLTLDPYRFIFSLSEPRAHGLEQLRCSSFGTRDDRHAGDLGDLLDRGEDQASRALAARQHRVAADGVPRPRARPGDHDLLPERRRSASTARSGSCSSPTSRASCRTGCATTRPRCCRSTRSSRSRRR